MTRIYWSAGSIAFSIGSGITLAVSNVTLAQPWWTLGAWLTFSFRAIRSGIYIDRDAILVEKGVLRTRNFDVENLTFIFKNPPVYTLYFWLGGGAGSCTYIQYGERRLFRLKGAYTRAPVDEEVVRIHNILRRAGGREYSFFLDNISRPDTDLLSQSGVPLKGNP